MVYLSWIPYMAAQKENKRLLASEAELMPIESVYKDSIRAKLTYEELNNMYLMTETRNDELYRFITELEDNLPSTVNVLSFSVSSEAVSINMNVESKEAAADVLQTIRKFDSVSDARVGYVTEEVDELGMGSVVNFTIECSYADITHEEETAESPADAASTESGTTGSSEDAALAADAAINE